MNMDKIVHIRLPNDVYEKLKKEAIESNRKISSMVRHILIQWTKEIKKD
jgi:hypothetical protein